MDAIENEKMKAFIEEVIEVSKKHGLSLGHEDIYGSFKLHKYNEDISNWLRECLTD